MIFDGGTFEGRDGLLGTIAPGGVDWQVVRPDGVIEIDAHYLLLTDDGESIEVRSRGIRKASAAVAERLALTDFLPAFNDWVFDWIDVPAIVRSAPGTYLFPMVDRDPVARWTFGFSTLLGDAAHPMYPIGSNGASQAILDARVLAGCLRADDHVLDAFQRYERVRLPATGAIVQANRGLGPEVPMQLVHERAPDGFDDVNSVITRAEIDEVTEAYRSTAGFALSALRADPRSLIEQWATVSAGARPSRPG